MKVLQVKDGMKIEPNCVYLNQPDKDVAIMNRSKDAYKEIVQDAQYRCQNCGRTAKSERNICEPVAL